MPWAYPAATAHLWTVDQNAVPNSANKPHPDPRRWEKPASIMIRRRAQPSFDMIVFNRFPHCPWVKQAEYRLAWLPIWFEIAFCIHRQLTAEYGPHKCNTLLSGKWGKTALMRKRLTRTEKSKEERSFTYCHGAAIEIRKIHIVQSS